jgi:hypothetical protein
MRVPRGKNANNRRKHVRKAWLIAGLAALAGLASSSYADVQNIRLSGDIRIRGYYLNGGGEPDTSFISQRTRISVEADLEDHVLVVVTLKAEGLWGAANESNTTSGTGVDDSNNPMFPRVSNTEHRINRLWDLGVTEV